MMKKAATDGMKAVALTDHGNMFGAFKFVAEAEKQGVKPIVGCEFYLVADRHKKQFTKTSKDVRYHQLLLAKNAEGYKNLSKLCSLGFIDGYYSKYPRIDKEILQKYSTGIIATSCCIGAEIPQTIIHKGEAEAEKVLKWYVDLFGKEDYYIELQRHGLMNIDGTGISQEDVNQTLLRLAKKYDLKVIATNDSHYVNEKDFDPHDILLCINTGEKYSTPKGDGKGQRFGFPNSEFFFKTQAEMNKLFGDLPQALDFTCEIADKVEKLKLKRDILLPNFPLPQGFATQDDFLKHLAFQGAAKKYGVISSEIEQRLNYELEIIQKMGFPGYFLIVQDFINAAKDIGVWVGPGRGCLTGEAKIVLHNGTTKNINNISKGDKIITIDGSIQIVKNTFKYEVKEELLNICTYYGEMGGVTLTKDHKVYVEKQQKIEGYDTWAESTQRARKKPEPIGECEWLRADEVKIGDWLFIPTPNIAVNNILKIDLAEFANGEDLQFDENFVYHYVRNPLCNTNQKIVKSPRYLDLDADWFTILGIFTGDGWTRKEYRPEVSFVFHKEHIEYITFLKNKIEKLGFEYSERQERNTLQIHIRNKFLYCWFKKLFNNYVSTAQTKHIPELVLYANKENIAAFLKGYNWADGHEDTHKFRFTTTSRELADQVRLLCWRIDLPASLGIDDRKDTREAFKNTGRSYYVTIPKDERIGAESADKNYFYKKVPNGILIKVRSITTVNNEKFVYDIEVENNHNYLTSSFLVHNSAAGSAVAYCVNITNVDPIKYKLLFERFLNPERVSMPDIDIDFDDEGRSKVIDYVVDKYGKNQVAQIVTYGTMAAKMSIKDVSRVLELPLNEANELAKLVPEKAGTTLAKAYEEVPELAAIRKGNDLRAKVLQSAEILEGSVRGTGIHAAGVIIAPDDITNYIPVCLAKDKGDKKAADGDEEGGGQALDLLVTQFDGKHIEDAGMLKMDFLGLKTLTIMRDAIDLIQQNHGVLIDLDKIPMDDLKTYQLYQRGNTVGTFQFESEGMQMYLRDLKPTNIEDLIAMNALYRPGPMDFIPTYINRKHGKEVTEYPHELLEPILNYTFGIMVYQEQIMQTAQVMAGYSLGGADLLRRAMGKKDKEKMAKEKDKFIEGAKKYHNVDAGKAGEVFAVMEKFAEYGFNRSHSAAYSVVAYQTAYLKANYPAEYMAAVMTHSMGTIEKISFFLEECKRMGLKVLGPDVNESKKNFSVNSRGEIRFGMGAVKGTGEVAVEEIIVERTANGHFKDIFEFASRVNLRTVNKKTFESLATAGGFDEFKEMHRAMFFAIGVDGTTNLEKIVKYGAAMQSEKTSSNVSLFLGGASGGQGGVTIPKLTDCDKWTTIEMLDKEKEVVGFYLSGHPLDPFKADMDTHCTCSVVDFAEHKNKDIALAGILGDVTIKQTKTGKSFALVNLTDYNGTLQLALFNDDYNKNVNWLKNGEFVFIRGKVEERYNQPNSWDFRAKSFMHLADLREKMTKYLEITLETDKLSQDVVQQLNLLLTKHSGNCELRVKVIDKDENIELPTRSTKFRVNPSNELLGAIRGLGLMGRVG
jgi:DNA polymerase-3 subunit alpha